MSETIRLSKVLKELNISIDRAVDFLEGKGTTVEKNPNSKIDVPTYDILVNEFRSDAKQKQASGEVVINKISDIKAAEKKEAEAKAATEKPAEKKPEIIETTKVELEGPKTVGKIDLEALKPKAKEIKKEVKEEVKKEEIKKEEAPKAEIKTESKEEKKGPKVIKVIDLDKINNTGKPKKQDSPASKKEQAEPKKAEAPKAEVKKEVKKEEPKKVEEVKKPEIKTEAKPEVKKEEIEEVAAVEPQKIETVYTKLDGPNFTGAKIDLSKFDKKKTDDKKGNQKGANNAADKKKRKRIQKNVKPEDVAKTGENGGNNNNRQGGNNNHGGGNNNNRQGGNNNHGGGNNNNRQGGQGQGGNRQGGQGGNRQGGQGGNRQGGGNFRGGNNRGPRVPQVELSDEDVKKQIKDTLDKLTNKGKGSKGAKHRRDKRKERREFAEQEQEAMDMDKTLHVTEFVTVNELASLMDVSVTEVISACMSLGIMVTMNQRLEADTIQLVADDFGFEAVFANAEEEISTEEEEIDNEEDLVTRAPIVTVMGHVDHGKTSLLDYVRKANVIAGESGGITQHIGAYNVTLPSGKRVAFLDTPGHEAFTAMRARGAQVTDIAIIVIAADDQIMPQTREAISHAQAAGVPMVFAINKVDKPAANPEKVKEQLAQMNLLVEDWGGTYQSQEISAKSGLGVEDLLEKVLLEAEVLDLKANPKRKASGTVVEAALDKGRGYVSTIIVQTGTLNIGDYVLAGSHHGKVRAMLDERGNNIKVAGPSTPVTILGLAGAPTAGDKFKVYEDEREAKQIATRRDQLQREQTIRTQKHITLDEIGRRIALGDFKELNIILKGDVDGSVEALTDSLQKLSTEEIIVNILHKGVGQITESDVLLASASDAIIIGFNVRPGVSAREIADKEEVEIRTYSIIYAAIEEIKEAMEGMLSPELKEQVTGNIEVRETFKVTKVGTIAGCMVLDGKVYRNSNVRIIRDGVVIHDGELASLKRFKDDVKEVNKGYECGLNIKNFNDIQVGDIIEAYETVEVKKKLK
ncbi:translation initiation factor IF-2 [Empedobacter tilapiae]|uniref:Translation initiation factor IF-2 n=1 Tax=Empedobacter tilapiae TaxID=2491114 RepID=A0A4Z1B6E2_9FLAO|nr:translation initiation factor IF-2 [Empedobacter tilapiae]TGN29443.1 translation initiation factor IF-2 [Empedobacter tilapiae]